jgi:hypothetical protein
MKLKTLSLVVAGLAAATLSSNAAIFQLINVQGGPGVDTIWANVNGSPMTSGFVTMGYFQSGVSLEMINTIPELVTQLQIPSNFTAVQTAVPGTSTDFAAPGYLAEQGASAGAVPTGSPLIGRAIYVIASDAANLASITGLSGFSMFTVGSFLADDPLEVTYTGNPAGNAPIIGVPGSFTGDLGLGEGTTSSLRLVAVPEPSAALLGALGALGLLRRRRI